MEAMTGFDITEKISDFSRVSTLCPLPTSVRNSPPGPVSAGERNRPDPTDNGTRIRGAAIEKFHV